MTEFDREREEEEIVEMSVMGDIVDGDEMESNAGRLGE